MDANGKYKKKSPKSGDKKIRSQIEIYEYLKERNKKRVSEIKHLSMPRMNPEDEGKIL